MTYYWGKTGIFNSAPDYTEQLESSSWYGRDNMFGQLNQYIFIFSNSQFQVDPRLLLFRIVPRGLRSLIVFYNIAKITLLPFRLSRKFNSKGYSQVGQNNLKINWESPHRILHFIEKCKQNGVMMFYFKGIVRNQLKNAHTPCGIICHKNIFLEFY